MALRKKLRDLANRAFGNRAANDNPSPLEYTLDDKGIERALQPPHDKNHVDTLHGIRVSDPFRPLEKIDAPETLAWIDRQNKKFEDFVQLEFNTRLRVIEFLEDAEPKKTRETLPSRRENRFFFWRKEKTAERWSLWMRDGEDETAPAKLLLDPLTIDPTGKTNIASADFSRDGKTIAYALSVSGSDKTTLKFMDVDSGNHLPDTTDEFYTSIVWDIDLGGFHYTHPRPDGSKAFDVKHHKMGTSFDDDTVVYPSDKPERWSSYFRLLQGSEGTKGNWEWISSADSGDNRNMILCRPIDSNEEFKVIFPLDKGTLNPVRQIGDKVLAMTTLDAPRSRLVMLDPNDASPEKWREILPQNDDILENVQVWQGKIFASYKHDTGTLIKAFDMDGNFLHDLPVPPLSVASLFIQRAKDETAFLTLNNFQESGNIYKYNPADNSLHLYRETIEPTNLKDCIVERLHATSRDGTKVPMTVIRHPDTVLDGTALTKIYGYGGFDISLDPGYSSEVAEWVRAGGIYVQANLRGGGEFGEDWYKNGKHMNKQNVFDDLIACAEHLIAEKYTSSARLCIEGGSNGGLLTLATALQRPDLFGAVISDVPVTDMFRFHIDSFYGFAWKGDYGDPDIKEDFNNAARYSPLHNVKKGLKHTPVLINTDLHDRRVEPWHAFKQAATMQAKEHPKSLTFLHVNRDGGHGGGMTMRQRFASIADSVTFVEKVLGPRSQKAYKAKLEKEKKAKKFWKFGT